MPHERRNFTRVLFDAPALLTTGNGTLEVHVLDLSLKGALIEVPAGLALPSGAVISSSGCGTGRVPR